MLDNEITHILIPAISARQEVVLNASQKHLSILVLLSIGSIVAILFVADSILE